MKTWIAALFAVAFLAGPAIAQTQTQFPTSNWGGFAPGRVECGKLMGANFNITTDQAIPISYPATGYNIDLIEISGPSVSLTTAAGGFYSGASKTGITVVANSQAYSTLTTNTANTTGNFMTATLSTAGQTTAFNTNTLYFSLTTGQGSAATANIRIYCTPHY